MAYILQALIGDANELAGCTAVGVRVVALPQGRALLPLVASARTTLAIPFCPLADGGELPVAIVALTAPLRKKVAYVEVEIFAGAGTQAAAVWEEGRLVLGPLAATDAINQALRLIGVEKDHHADEFEALNLSRHRDTEEWR